MDPPQQIIFYDSKSILVIDPIGKMKQKFVPFMVKCIFPLKAFALNTKVYVEQVQAHSEHLIIFQIQTSWYPYWCFNID